MRSASLPLAALYNQLKIGWSNVDRSDDWVKESCLKTNIQGVIVDVSEQPIERAKKTALTLQWPEKTEPPAQLIINQHRWQIISDRRSATTFNRGSKPDFQLFQDGQTAISRQISCPADSVDQDRANLPAKSWRPKKKSKPHPLSRPEKMTRQHLGGGRIQIEPVIGQLKACAIRCRRYGKRRRSLWLGFNLMFAIYNLELKLKSWLMPEVYYYNLALLSWKLISQINQIG